MINGNIPQLIPQKILSVNQLAEHVQVAISQLEQLPTTLGNALVGLQGLDRLKFVFQQLTLLHQKELEIEKEEASKSEDLTESVTSLKEG